jgi:hypothetical protein
MVLLLPALIASVQIIFFSTFQEKTWNREGLIKRIVFVYDQPVRQWPQRNRTDRVVPAIFLPLQSKAFHLYKSEYTRSRALVLDFDVKDDSSLIQVLAKSFEGDSWVYADTILPIRQFSNGIHIFRIGIKTRKSQNFAAVPIVELISLSFDQKNYTTLLRNFLHYVVPTTEMSGNDKQIYLKNGYDDLFKTFSGKRLPIIKATEIKD